MNDQTPSATTEQLPAGSGDAATPAEETASSAGGQTGGQTGNTPGPPPTPQPTPQPDPLNRGFSSLRHLGLHRDTTRSWIGGVCSGIAERLSIDPVIVRAGFVVLGLLGGVGFLAYLLAWVLLPDQNGTIVAERALRQGDVGSIVVLALAAFAGFIVFGVSIGDNGGRWGLGWVIVIIGAVFLLTRRGSGTTSSAGAAPYAAQPGPVPADPTGASGGSTAYEGLRPSGYPAPGTYAATGGYQPAAGYAGTSANTGASGATAPPVGQTTWTYPPQPPAPPRRRWLGWPGFLLVSGLAIAAYGIGRALDAPLDLAGNGAQLGRVLALVVIGIALVVTGLTGRKGGLLSFVGVILAMVVGLNAMVPDMSVRPNAGSQSWVPDSSVTSVDYGLGVGSAVLDLSELPTDPAGIVTITGQVGAGGLTVLVPADLTAEITTEVGAGYLGVHDPTATSAGTIQETSGAPVSRVTTFGTGATDVVVKLDVGLGSVNLERQPAS